MDPLIDFSHFEFEHDKKRRTVYRKGTGPAVIIIHEVPGITPEGARFARYVVEAGMTGFLPHLFGVPGKPVSRAYATVELARACIVGNFMCSLRTDRARSWIGCGRSRAGPTMRSEARAWARSACALPEILR
jgi:dienelactone hydrolase